MLIFQINYRVCGQNLGAAGSFIKKKYTYPYAYINACCLYYLRIYVYNKCSVFGPSTQALGYPLLYAY